MQRNTAILTGKAAAEAQGAYRKGARFYVYYTGPPTIHEDIYVVRLSRQPFRTFRLRTDAERFVEARDIPLPPPFDPDTLRLADDLIICSDGSYTSATPTDPPRAGWGYTVMQGHEEAEYAFDKGPLDHADLVELNGASAEINNVRAELVAVLEALS